MEDWVLGEYEADITFWGPIGGEYIMETVLNDAVTELKTDVGEFFDPERGPWQYHDWDYGDYVPDITDDAGTKLVNDTIPADAEDGSWAYFVPKTFTEVESFEIDFDIPEEVPRLGGVIQLGWIGGDPSVDSPRVILQRLTSEDADPELDASWESVKSTPAARSTRTTTTSASPTRPIRSSRPRRSRPTTGGPSGRPSATSATAPACRSAPTGCASRAISGPVATPSGRGRRRPTR